MPAPNLDNVAGHRAKYEHLKANLPADQVGVHFVGSSDPLWTGYNELEIIRKFCSLSPRSSIVDIGCGIGRLTRHLLHENIGSYLGTDVVEEIMSEAQDLAAKDPRFRFSLVDCCTIPADDGSVDVVAAYSVITHLIDEEVLAYLQEARRVLKPGGVALFSFLDLVAQSQQFFTHARTFRSGHGDLLKFTTKEALQLFADEVGFAEVEFVDGFAHVPTSGVISELVSEPPSTFHLGQAVCALR